MNGKKNSRKNSRKGKSMKVEKIKNGEVLTVKIEGALDINTAPELKKELNGEPTNAFCIRWPLV